MINLGETFNGKPTTTATETAFAHAETCPRTATETALAHAETYATVHAEAKKLKVAPTPGGGCRENVKS